MTSAFKCDSCDKYINGTPYVKFLFDGLRKTTGASSHDLCQDCASRIMVQWLHYNTIKVGEDLQ